MPRALQCHNPSLVVIDYFALNFKEYTDKIIQLFQLNPHVNAFIYLVTSFVLSRIMSTSYYYKINPFGVIQDGVIIPVHYPLHILLLEAIKRYAAMLILS